VKLTVAYSLLVLLVAGTLTVGMYVQLRRVERQAIAIGLKEILILAQSQIDADLHALLLTPNDASSPYYKVLKERLATIQRASDAIHHIYTLRQTPDGQIQIVLDQRKPGQKTDAIGTPLDAIHHIYTLRQTPDSQIQIVLDQRKLGQKTDAIGTPLSEIQPALAAGLAAVTTPVVEQLIVYEDGIPIVHGYAPIVDSLGRQDAVLAIDLDASESIASEARARNLALLAFVIVFPWALGSGYWLTRRLTAPIGELVEGVERIAAGDLSHHVRTRNRDEIGLLAERFNEMSDRLRDSFETLEAKVAERTNQLTQTNDDLQSALVNLQRTQIQLIQAEKMLGLGQMVAGIAHEINNPVGFIHSNLHYVEQYSQDLLAAIASYQRTYPNPEPEVAADLNELDLDFIATDFPKILHSMQVGTQRIQEIVLALRNFSRLDEAQFKDVDLREGLDSTLLMVQHRLHGENGLPGIQVMKEYADVPPVECCPGQLNQVFLNLLNNAIDALQESQTANPIVELRVGLAGDSVRVAIADNGPGMSPEVQQQVFNPFFTTKPVGRGTGLGLATSYTIIVAQHHGTIDCHSTPGQGSEFVITIPCRQAQGERMEVMANHHC